MNHTADQWQKDNDSGEKKPRGIFRRLMSHPFLVLGVIVVGIAGLLLTVFVFDAQRSAPQSLLSALKTGPKVFRKKLPQEIKIAQNLFRGKIPALDQPVNSQSKIESIPTVEKTTPSQPVVAALEKSQPRGESGPDRPAESQIRTETAPAEVKAAPSQPVVAALEKSQPREESGPDRPAEPQITLETAPAEVKAAPSRPVVAALEKSQPRGESGPDRPAEPQITIETAPAEVKAAPSQPIVAAPEKSEPRGASELDQPADPQTSIEATVLPPEGQSESSQLPVAPSEQRESIVKAPLHQAAVKPLPMQAPADKEGVTRKTEKRSMHSEKWLLTQESSYYTIQLMGARKEALLFDFVARNKLLEQNEIAFYQTTYKDKPWFQLLYGVYTTKKEAQSAADYLPPKIRKSSPWIRRLSAVQKAIRNRAAQ
ncbi:MAG: SPOR domain-containing protein [Desulfobacterales bacterium]